jgi:DNA primase
VELDEVSLVSSEILELAQKYLRKVKNCGNDNIMAICPFHRDPVNGGDEHTASFTMSLTRGLYHCFSCHESGPLGKFLKQMGVSSARIATEYKYVLEDVERFRSTKPNPLRVTVAAEPLPEGLLGLFDSCPTRLLNEGYEESLLAKLDIGFDKRHQRITFPLRDEQGRLVGISGRTVTDERPRYKVYDTEYLAFDLPARETKKRALLWNLHSVYPAVYLGRDGEKSVVVVEGFKACMKLLQAGIINVVALLGSHMSLEQQWTIERLGADAVYLMLDNDDAGYEGRVNAGRALSKALSDVRIVEYEADQPSDLDGEGIHEALHGATEYHLWKIRQHSTYTTEQPYN